LWWPPSCRSPSCLSACPYPRRRESPGHGHPWPSRNRSRRSSAVAAQVDPRTERFNRGVATEVHLPIGPNAVHRPRASGAHWQSGDRLVTAVLWQHGFELPPHPFKVTVQLGDDRTMREVRTVHTVGYERYAEPSPGRILGTNKKPKTESADCERCHPGGDAIAAQATDQPCGYRSHKPDATDQNYIVPHSALRFLQVGDTAWLWPNDRATELTSGKSLGSALLVG
jgi:hypothetical protein